MSKEAKENGDRTSLSNELARERNREAAERTLLAWLRTCLSLITFGFAIYKLVQVFNPDKSSHMMTAIIGLCFILLGVFAMIAATYEHSKVLEQIKSDDYAYKPSGLGRAVSITLALIGVLACITVVLELFVYKLP